MDEKITLIIPVYNEIVGIEKSLKNIKKFSDGKSNWKIIIVDDGSDDGTEKLLDKIIDDKISVLVHENEFKLSFIGLGSCILDVDDSWDSEKCFQ